MTTRHDGLVTPFKECMDSLLSTRGMVFCNVELKRSNGGAAAPLVLSGFDLKLVNVQQSAEIINLSKLPQVLYLCGFEGLSFLQFFCINESENGSFAEGYAVIIPHYFGKVKGLFNNPSQLCQSLLFIPVITKIAFILKCSQSLFVKIRHMLTSLPTAY